MRKGHNIITTMPWLYLELNGKQLRIDSEDSLNIYSWRENKSKPSYWLKLKITINDGMTGYKSHKITINNKKYILSRVIYKAHNPEWDIGDNSKTNKIDHIDRNPLDNRIENLRILTQQQNTWNRGAKGYHWDKENNKWVARIKFNKKTIYLGRFIEEADAAQAYLTAKEKYHIMPILN